MASLGNGIHCTGERQCSIDAVVHAVQLATGQAIAGNLSASTLDLLDYREAHFFMPSVHVSATAVIDFIYHFT